MHRKKEKKVLFTEHSKDPTIDNGACHTRILFVRNEHDCVSRSIGPTDTHLAGKQIRLLVLARVLHQGHVARASNDPFRSRADCELAAAMPRAVAYNAVPAIVCLRDTATLSGKYRDFYLADKRGGVCASGIPFSCLSLVCLFVCLFLFSPVRVFSGFSRRLDEVLFLTKKILEPLTRWNTSF